MVKNIGIRNTKSGWFFHHLVKFSVEFNNPEYDIMTIVKVSLFENDHIVRTTDELEPVQSIGMRLCNFLNGHMEDFNDLKLDFRGLSPFQIQVLETARKIGRGAVVTYSHLAELAGFPNAVRAVASVMRANRFPLIIPCHRVVRKDGSSGGYCGQLSGPMFELKQQLLQMEQRKIQ